jgi:tetratricopeptide (TPR) repeat protein
MTQDKEAHPQSQTVRWTSFERRPLLYGLLLACAAGLLLMTIGIYVTDTDLWYHLSGGRYFFSEHRVPSSSFFSFIQPEKQWNNYYWLFQVIVYAIFRGMSYYGLIVLRCLLYGGIVFAGWAILARDARGRIDLLSVHSILAVLLALAILPRAIIVRPHLFSYLMMAVFLLILDSRSPKTWLLPLLGLFWVNVHGIQYPVMIMILCAYLGDMFLDRYRNESRFAQVTRRHRTFIVIALYVVLLTPHGFSFLRVPFDRAMLQHHYIEELKLITAPRLFSYAVYPWRAIPFSCQNLLILLVVLCVVILLLRRKFPAAPLLLCAGGTVLLTQADRFRYDFLLLSLPLLREGVAACLQRAPQERIRRRLLFVPAAALLVFVAAFVGYRGRSKPYPFYRGGLPCGVTRFLKMVNTGGNVLNHPNAGGYLAWELYPEYRIYMDLQMSVFSDEDFLACSGFFLDKEIFRHMTNKYDLAFISVPAQANVETLEDETAFTPVFIDGAEILYLNKARHAQIAAQYGLQYLDLYKEANVDLETVDAEKLPTIRTEMERVASIDPGNYVAHTMLGNLCLLEKEFEEALLHGNKLIETHPHTYSGHFIRGTALYEKRQFLEAKQCLERAARRAPPANRMAILKNLYYCYVQLGQHRRAYRLLRRELNPFDIRTEPRMLYQLAASAAQQRKRALARIYLRMAKLRAPPDDTELQDLIENLDRLIAPRDRKGESPSP